MIFQLKNIFDNFKFKKNKHTLLEDEEGFIGNDFPNKKEVKEFYQKKELIYPYSQKVEDILLKIYTDKDKITLIRYSEYYLDCFFENNTMISYWIANENYGIASQGEVKIGSREVTKWDRQQPSKELACYLKKFAEKNIEDIEQHNINVFEDRCLKIFEYNKEIDSFIKLINDNPETIIGVVPKEYENKIIIKLKNNTHLKINCRTITGNVHQLAANGVLEHNGKVILEWEDSSPSALELYRFGNLIEKKLLEGKVVSNVSDKVNFWF